MNDLEPSSSKKKDKFYIGAGFAFLIAALFLGASLLVPNGPADKIVIAGTFSASTDDHFRISYLSLRTNTSVNYPFTNPSLNDDASSVSDYTIYNEINVTTFACTVDIETDILYDDSDSNYTEHVLVIMNITTPSNVVYTYSSNNYSSRYDSYVDDMMTIIFYWHSTAFNYIVFDEAGIYTINVKLYTQMP